MRAPWSLLFAALAHCAAAGAPCSQINSAPCIQAWLAITNKARAKERVKAMVLPSNYARLTVPQQNLVLINLERHDRGLPKFSSPLVSKYNSLALAVCVSVPFVRGASLLRAGRTSPH